MDKFTKDTNYRSPNKRGVQLLSTVVFLHTADFLFLLHVYTCRTCMPFPCQCIVHVHAHVYMFSATVTMKKCNVDLNICFITAPGSPSLSLLGVTNTAGAAPGAGDVVVVVQAEGMGDAFFLFTPLPGREGVFCRFRNKLENVQISLCTCTAHFSALLAIHYHTYLLLHAGSLLCLLGRR